MKGRQERGVASIVIHVVLAALALVLAFWTWTADKTKVGPSEVVALDVSKQDIQSLTFKDESRTVQVERRTGSDGEAYAWLTVTTRSKALTTNAAAAGGNPHGGMMPAPPPPSARSLRDRACRHRRTAPGDTCPPRAGRRSRISDTRSSARRSARDWRGCRAWSAAAGGTGRAGVRGFRAGRRTGSRWSWRWADCWV